MPKLGGRRGTGERKLSDHKRKGRKKTKRGGRRGWGSQRDGEELLGNEKRVDTRKLLGREAKWVLKPSS